MGGRRAPCWWGAGGSLRAVEDVLRGEDADGSLRAVERVLRTVVHQHGEAVLPDERVGAAAAAVAGQGGLQVGRVEAAAAVGVVHVVPAVWKFPPPKTRQTTAEQQSLLHTTGQRQRSNHPSPGTRGRKQRYGETDCFDKMKRQKRHNLSSPPTKGRKQTACFQKG